MTKAETDKDHTPPIEDISVRPAHEAMTDLMDRLDAQRDAIANSQEESVKKAGIAIKGDRHGEAADIYETVAAAYRTAGFPSEADYWMRRASDCREVIKHRAKLKKGGRR